eukprot:Hpha_TRINITY_DN15613_c0_g7::TRINITY_DN15613_c0_g7_i1::g.100099::m.100099
MTNDGGEDMPSASVAGKQKAPVKNPLDPESSAPVSGGGTEMIQVSPVTSVCDLRESRIQEGSQRCEIPPEKIAMNFAILAVCGAFQGFLLQRSHVPVPEVIYDQMIFKRFAVMKMFMAALGASMCGQAILTAHNAEAFEKTRFYRYRKSGLLRVLPGCVMLGVGMTLCGSGPSMLPANFFVAEHGWRMVAGAFLGAMAFALIDSYVYPLKARRELATEEDLTVLDKLIGVSYVKLASFFGCVCLAIALGLEFMFPFDGCSSGVRCNENIPGVAAAWPPSLAGLAIGINQIPLRIITGDGQGGSTWFMNAISTVTCGKLPSVEGMEMTKLTNCYQTVYAAVGISAGAFIASCAYDELFYYPNFHWARDIAGAACMIFGARVAGGCTCGHGISGSSELSLESLAGTAGIFGGAIISAMIIEYAILGHPSAL